MKTAEELEAELATERKDREAERLQLLSQRTESRLVADRLVDENARLRKLLKEKHATIGDLQEMGLDAWKVVKAAS